MVPVVRSIRDCWPGTRITWIIGKREHRLLRGLGQVEFIEFDKHAGWNAVSELRKKLNKRRFDVLLHMQVAVRANLLSKLIRAPIRLGWDHGRARDFHQFFVRQQVANVPFQHQAQGFLEFPRALGIEVGEPRWNLPVEKEAMQWSAEQLGHRQDMMLINACSSHPLRNWPAARYAAVADYASSQMGMGIVLCGGSGTPEIEMGASIETTMKTPCLNLVGKDTLERSKALLKQAAVVLAPDCGPVHIASALGTPVIGLYAATWSRRSGPYNSLDLCVDRFADAARKFKNRTPEALRWGTRIEEPGVMDLIGTNDVIEKLKGLM